MEVHQGLLKYIYITSWSSCTSEGECNVGKNTTLHLSVPILLP